jgi:hypothetical protein
MAKLDVVNVVIPPLSVPVPKVVLPDINVTVPVAADGVTAAEKVTGALGGAGFVEEESATADACLTTCISFEEVLLLQLLSPPYEAVMECDPRARVDVLYVAVPLLMVPVPSVVAPSKKVTVPVAVDGVMVAVKVTEDPNVEGLADEATVTVEFALLTVCVRVEEVLELSLESPP